MTNSYLIAGLIIVVVVLGVVLRSNRIEAPISRVSEEDNKGVFLDGRYNLQASSSVVSWEGEYLAGLSENGTVRLSSGEFVIKDGVITSGEFIMDMSTIESIPHKDILVTQLKGDDFFGVQSYPTAKFVFKKMIPSSVEGAKIGRFVIAGDLTVRGIVKPISFTTTLKNEGDSLSATTSFAINRADWEIKYNSPTFFQNLGDKVIRDAVIIGLDLKAVRVLQ